MIPTHMSKCPVHGGLPVPAVVATRKGHIDLCPSSWPWFSHMTRWVPEGDDPDFAKYDEQKLRECVAGRFCHVCTQPLEIPRLLCLPKHRKPDDDQMIDVRGQMVPLVKQPWVCHNCLRYAVRKCPPLRAAIDEGRGLVAWVSEHAVVATQWQPAAPGDPQPPEGATVLSFIKIAIVKARYMPLPEWARRFAP